MTKDHSIQNICLIGSGNVAWVLGKALVDKGINITQVYSRNEQRATALAAHLNSSGIAELSKISKDADLYLLAISDDAINTVAKELSAVLDIEKNLIAHTSGTKASTSLLPFYKASCFYMPQSMTKGTKVDFSTVPFCIFSNEKESEKILDELAKKLSDYVFIIDDEQKQILHLSAVMLNNFANHWFGESFAIMQKNNIPFDVLKPLLKMTYEKAMNNNPFDVQTGPAKREDYETIEKHINHLSDDPELQSLYKAMTDRIIKKSRSKD